MGRSLKGPHSPGSDSVHSAEQFLLARINYERMQVMPYHERLLKLDRLRRLLAGLGNPHMKWPAVHIAGTKGKGSTAAMIASVLGAAGYRTGLYTSPHLERLEERIVIDGRPLSAQRLAELVERARPVVEAMDHQAADAEPPEIGPTYFELTTALAMLHFAEQGVGVAVLEVGLGGRLDSTNVCRPVVSIITSISRDHCRQLGESLSQIAREKAGIIRPGVPVVSGATQPEAQAVIREVAGSQGAPLRELGVDFQFHYEPPRDLHLADRPGRLDYWTLAPQGSKAPAAQPLENPQAPETAKGLRADPIAPPRAGGGSHGKTSPERAPGGCGGWPAACGGMELWLPGRHQAANAAVALAALAELVEQGWKITEQAVREGLAGARCPGRVEVVARRPTVVLDTAHNDASVESLLAVLGESFRARRRLLLMAATKEKDVRAMLERLVPAFDQLVFTRYQSNPRAVAPEELARLARELCGKECRVEESPAAAWQMVRAAAGPEDLICVTGSFFLAGEIRALLRG